MRLLSTSFSIKTDTWHSFFAVLVPRSASS